MGSDPSARSKSSTSSLSIQPPPSKLLPFQVVAVELGNSKSSTLVKMLSEKLKMGGEGGVGVVSCRGGRTHQYSSPSQIGGL